MNGVDQGGAVSVIVPFYQARTTLDRCVQSVVDQTFSRWELLVVDDGSSDGGDRVAREWARRDPRVRVLCQQNAGRSAARNRGIEDARGEWVAFLDADDALLPDALARLLDVAGNAPLVCGGYRGTSGIEQLTAHPPMVVQARDVAREVAGEHVAGLPDCGDNTTVWRAVWGKLYSARVIEGGGVRFADGLRFGEDALFNLEYLKHVDAVALTGVAAYLYNDVEQGTCGTFSSQDAPALQAFAKEARVVMAAYVDRGVVDENRVEAFVGAEAAMLLRRAGARADDLKEAARSLASTYRDPSMQRALRAFVPQGPKARLLHGVRCALVRNGMLRADLVLERLAFKSHG